MSQANLYRELADSIIAALGGKNNIANFTHCATRLRVNLKDRSIVDEAAVRTLDGVMGCQWFGDQFQVVIGAAVEDVYRAVTEIVGTSAARGAVTDDGTALEQREPGLLGALRFYGGKVFDIISGSFTPVIPAFCGAGLMKALLSILTMAGLLQTTDSTYAVLAAASNSVFYFLPIILSVSMARKLGANAYVAAAVAGALLEPNFTGLGDAGSTSSFLGIPMVLMSYASTIFPALLSTTLLYYVERLLKRVILKDVQVVFVPTLCLLIVVPITMLLVGPFGYYVGEALSGAVFAIMGSNAALAGFILGFVWMFVVLFGLHWAIIPILLANIAQYGSDLTMSVLSMTIFAAAGAAAGVFLKAKDPKLKSIAGSAFIPAIVGGVTEPVIYGISLRYRKSMIEMCLMTGIASAFVGFTGVEQMSSAGGLPALLSPTNIPLFAIGAGIAFFGTAIVHVVLGFGEDAQSEARIDAEQAL